MKPLRIVTSCLSYRQVPESRWDPRPAANVAALQQGYHTTKTSPVLQLRAQIAQNLAHLKGPPGVQFHERAPDAMDVDELPTVEAKVCLAVSKSSGRTCHALLL